MNLSSGNRTQLGGDGMDLRKIMSVLASFSFENIKWWRTLCVVSRATINVVAAERSGKESISSAPVTVVAHKHYTFLLLLRGVSY
jgi:hypothetical protein